MAKELKFVILLDCYGELLTDKQRDYMELYYCEDLSLSEISDEVGITRQGVRDCIKKGETLLFSFEEKLRLLSKFFSILFVSEYFQIQLLLNIDAYSLRYHSFNALV